MVNDMMEKAKSGSKVAGLVFAGLLSGLFVLIVSVLDEGMSPMAFLSLAYAAAAAPVGLFGIKRVIKIKSGTFRKGILFGAQLTCTGYLLIKSVPSTDPISLCGLYNLTFIFIVPILIILRERVNFLAGISTLMAVIAQALIIDISLGDLKRLGNIAIVILADVIYASYLIGVDRLGRDEDTVQLVFSQNLSAAAISFAGWIITRGYFPAPSSLENVLSWIGVILTGLLFILPAGLLRISAQKYISVLETGLILSVRVLILIIPAWLIIQLSGVTGITLTNHRYVGCAFLVIAVLLSNEKVQKRLGYHDMDIGIRNVRDGSTVIRMSLAGKVILAVLSLSLITLLLGTALTMVSIRSINQTVTADSEKDGLEASQTSMDMLLKDLESDLNKRADDKAMLAEEKLSDYAMDVLYAATYAQSLYQHPDEYPAREVEPVRAEDEGRWTMRRTLASRDISYEDLQRDCMLLGNMEDVFVPIVENDPQIATIYIATEDGLMISYDCDSGENGTAEKGYYEYRKAGWYQTGIKSEAYAVTDPYADAYGKGQVITFSAPVKSPSGNALGCIGIDLRIREIEEAIVKYGIVSPWQAVMINPDGKVMAGGRGESSSEFSGTIYDESVYGALSLVADQILQDRDGIFKSGEGKDAVYVACAPVDSVNWLLCMEAPVSEVTESAETIRETINANTENVTESIREGALQNFRNILVLTELILLAITISSEQMSKKITDPIRQLEHDVNVISTGNLKQRVEVSSEDEIGSLAASFNNMADSLEKYIADVKEMTAKEERMAADMALAKQIQAAMLPKNFEEFTEGRNFELHASMKPAKDVGGDFYDFFMIDDTHLALAIADVSGKGVPAALFMARAMTSLRMRSLAGGSLSQIMSDVNDAMCERNDEGLFVTIWMAVIDLETGRGMASNAGHENPVLRRAGGSYRVVNYKHSIFIGAMQGMPFEEHSFQLKAGDSIFVYTDGVAEAKREEKLFGTTRLTRTLNRDPDADPAQVIRNVDEAILEFTAGEEQFDDITMLCVKYLGPDSAESPEKS